MLEAKILLCLTCEKYVFIDGEKEKLFEKFHKHEHGHPVVRMSSKDVKEIWQVEDVTKMEVKKRYSSRFKTVDVPKIEPKTQG